MCEPHLRVELVLIEILEDDIQFVIEVDSPTGLAFVQPLDHSNEQLQQPADGELQVLGFFTNTLTARDAEHFPSDMEDPDYVAQGVDYMSESH